MYVIVAFRQRTPSGDMYNSAILLGKDGKPLPAVHSGLLSYYKSFPVLYETAIHPGNSGVQAWVSRHDSAGIWAAFFQECQRHRCGQDLEGIGRVSILICFDIVRTFDIVPERVSC